MALPLKGLATQDLMEVLMVSRAALECKTVDELIPELLRHLEGVFKTGNNNFFFSRRVADALDLDRVVTRGIEKGFIAQFREYYHRLDPFLKCLESLDANVLTTEQLISFKDLTRSEYYNDFLAPQGIHHQMSIFLRKEQRLLGVLSLFRPRNACGFSSLDQAKANLMAPYLAKALEKNMATYMMMERKSFIDCIVAGLPCKGVIVVDCSLEAIYQDKNAATIISELNGGKEPSEPSFEPLPMAISRRCREILHHVDQGRATEAGQHHLCLRAPRSERKVEVHLRLITQRNRNPLLLICLDPDKYISFFSKRSAIYGLTAREMQVVSLVSRGLKNKDIAETLYISKYTVENHLKSIYRKTGVMNRTSLIHLLNYQNSTGNWLTNSRFPD